MPIQTHHAVSLLGIAVAACSPTSATSQQPTEQPPSSAAPLPVLLDDASVALFDLSSDKQRSAFATPMVPNPEKPSRPACHCNGSARHVSPLSESIL